MKKINTLSLAFILLTIMIMAACSATENQAELPGSTWRLISYGPLHNQTAAVPDIETSLRFDKDGKMGGNLGCNSFSGDFKVNADQIIIGQVAATMMYCQEPVMQQENATLQAISSTNSFQLNADRLIFTSANGETAIIFERVGN